MLTHRSTARFCVSPLTATDCRAVVYARLQCTHAHARTHALTHTHAHTHTHHTPHTHTDERDRGRRTERQTERGSKPCSVQFFLMFYSGLLSSIHACNSSYRNTPYPRVTNSVCYSPRLLVLVYQWSKEPVVSTGHKAAGHRTLVCLWLPSSR